MEKKYPLLEQIDDPKDLKGIPEEDLKTVCKELREFIIGSVLTHGGHFAANLGVVELTVALHYVFNTPDDRMVWDVGHQAYAHKILTGRRERFQTNRQTGGISGFPSMAESAYDAFGTGHSSTAISAVTGMAAASALRGNEERWHIAIVGDGALTSGEALEGLNNLGVSDWKVLVVVNDNNIGIDPTTGAISRHLAQINSRSNLFTNLGLPYEGPVDGHDIGMLVSKLKEIKDGKGPWVLHVKTIKGMGYPDAEREQTKWHSTTRFVKIEQPGPEVELNRLKYQDIFGKTLAELAADRPEIAGVTPAMPTGSGMIHAMEKFPDRFFDTGIAEQHAVTFSAGMAREGFTVFCSLYSTFLQRAMDQIIHDVCLQNLPVIFCIDRAGNVGDDGPTHHGMFDIPLLRSIPGITMLAPSTGHALREMMHYYATTRRGPVAIRYPKGIAGGQEPNWAIHPVSAHEPAPECVLEGWDVVFFAVGNMVAHCLEAASDLSEDQIFPSVYDVKRLKPFPEELTGQIAPKYRLVVCVEDGVVSGGFGELVFSNLIGSGTKTRVICVGYPDSFIPHGNSNWIYRKYGLDRTGLRDLVLANFE